MIFRCIIETLGLKTKVFNTLQEIRRRGLKVAVAGIPKTIDNDISVRLLDLPKCWITSELNSTLCLTSFIHQALNCE